jgi:hypothetical protein
MEQSSSWEANSILNTFKFAAQTCRWMWKMNSINPLSITGFHVFEACHTSTSPCPQQAVLRGCLTSNCGSMNAVKRQMQLLCACTTACNTYNFLITKPTLCRMAAPHQRRLFAVHVGFVVDSVVLGQVSLRVILFSPVSIIPQLLHVYWGMDNGPVSGPVPQRHSLTPPQR